MQSQAGVAERGFMTLRDTFHRRYIKRSRKSETRKGTVLRLPNDTNLAAGGGHVEGSDGGLSGGLPIENRAGHSENKGSSVGPGLT